MHFKAHTHVATCIATLFGSLVALHSGAANAQCSMPPSAGDQTVYLPPTMYVSSRLPIGSMIGRAYDSAPLYSHPTIACSPWTSVRTYTKPLVLWGSGIYATNVPGVGIRILRLDNGAATNVIPYTFTTNSHMGATQSGYRVEFYKIGPVNYGVLEAGRYAQHTLNGSYVTSVALPSVPISGRDPSCDFGTFSDVHLGSVPGSQFVAPGSTTEWKQFALRALDCFDTTTVAMTFTGTANPVDSSLFASTGTASGVAIELQTQAGAPAIPNSPTPVTFAASDGPSTFGMRARIKQTDSRVQSGDVSAAITVNITYN